MTTTDNYKIIRVAKKYYESHMGQLEIARQEGVSKSTISRMLKKAMELGYIKVSVEAPIEPVKDVAEEIRDKYNLKQVFVVPDYVDNDEIATQDVCKALAGNLETYIKNDTVVAVSWGKTLNTLARKLTPLSVEGIKVVQMNGGVAKSASATGASQIVDALTKAGKGTGYMFPVPAIVDSKEIADTLHKDSQVRNVLNLAKEADVTIFSIGVLSKNSILYEVGYLHEEDYNYLESHDAVGDIASRFFKKDGTIAGTEFNDRVVGLSLEKLKEKKWNIAIAVGEKKVDAIIGALKGGYVNVLYTDEKTARLLL